MRAAELSSVQWRGSRVTGLFVWGSFFGLVSFLSWLLGMLDSWNVPLTEALQPALAGFGAGALLNLAAGGYLPLRSGAQDRAQKLILAYASRRGGRITLEETAAICPGLGLAEADRLLRGLVKDGYLQLNATDDGAYEFPGLRDLDEDGVRYLQACAARAVLYPAERSKHIGQAEHQAAKKKEDA